MLILGAHISLWSIFCFHCFGTYTLSLNKLETDHRHLQIVLYFKKTGPWKAKEIQRWGNTEARRASEFSRNSHWCYDSTICSNQLWKGAEQQLKCKKGCTIQSHFSYLPKSKCPMGMSCNICSVKKWGCKPRGYCNDLWGTGFVSLNFFLRFVFLTIQSTLWGRDYVTTVPHPAPGTQLVLNKYML